MDVECRVVFCGILISMSPLLLLSLGPSLTQSYSIGPHSKFEIIANNGTTHWDHNLQSSRMWIFILIEWWVSRIGALVCTWYCSYRTDNFFINGSAVICDETWTLFHCFMTNEQHIDCNMVCSIVSVRQFNRLS